MFDARGKEAAAELAFYAPALIVAGLLCFRHGFGRQLGWFYVLALCLVRIVGAACQIAAEQNPSTGLLTAAYICSSIGLAPLVLALLGIIKRVNEGMTHGGLNPTFFRVAQLISLVGLILVILGGVDESNGDPNKLSEGRTFMKAGVLLFFLFFIMVCCLHRLQPASRSPGHQQ